MSLTREQIAQSASKKLLAAAPTLSSSKATVGLDGFVDEIIGVVDKRQSAVDYTLIKTIDVLGKKITGAAGHSSNYELLVKQTKLGGNGPIMANALAAAGMGITYIGSLGYPTIHPIFNEFAARAQLHSVADAAHTDALEFEDGKLMLGKHQALKDVNWQNIIDRVGLETLKTTINESKLVAMNNWTMLPFMSDIWNKLLTEVFPKVTKADRKFFVDLADPEKRTREDIASALQTLSKFQSQADVMLGINLKEATQVCDVLGLPINGDPESQIETTAKSIREKLGIHCCVVHLRRGAAGATKDEVATFKGPFVTQPKISTGAGDHFNAGFCLGRVIGLTLAESLATGAGTSGYYVRTGISPSAKELAEFLANLPAPQN